MSDQKHNYTGYLIVNLRYKKDFCRWNKMFARALEARKWSKRKNYKYTHAQHHKEDFPYYYATEPRLFLLLDLVVVEFLLVD